MGKNLYELLGLNSNASEKEVRDRYKIASSTYNDSDEWRQISAEMSDFFANGKEAYDAKINSFNKENDDLFNMINGRKQDTIYSNLVVEDKSYPELRVYSSNEEPKKVNVNKKTNFGKKWKIIILGVLGVTILGSAAAKTNLETVEVPVPESASISDINELYDTSWYNLVPTDWFTDKDKAYENDKINLIVSNERVEEIENKANVVKNSNEEKIESYYPFKYTVIYGDTKYGLEERFGDDCKISDSLTPGKDIIIHTKNKELAEEMQSFYDEEQAKKEPISFEKYVIKQGELLPNIANAYDVTCDQIKEYNPGKVGDAPNYKIDAGDTLEIPVYGYKDNYSK